MPTLFYFSVWELGIAGHELALLALLSPILLYWIPRLHVWVETLDGAIAVKGMSLFLGLGAYKVPGPGIRLVCVTLANVGMTLVTVIEWSTGDLTYKGLCGSHTSSHRLTFQADILQ